MAGQPPHATVFDIPGWPCPARVRDIPGRENSWGWIGFPSGTGQGESLAQDETGRLWVNGGACPVFKLPDAGWDNPGALVFWTEAGIGLWIHPKGFKSLPSVSRLDMAPDDWLPVREVTAEWPTFIKEAAS